MTQMHAFRSVELPDLNVNLSISGNRAPKIAECGSESRVKFFNDGKQILNLWEMSRESSLSSQVTRDAAGMASRGNCRPNYAAVWASNPDLRRNYSQITPGGVAMTCPYGGNG